MGETDEWRETFDELVADFGPQHDPSRANVALRNSTQNSFCLQPEILSWGERSAAGQVPHRARH